jgi:hypothetical protein
MGYSGSLLALGAFFLSGITMIGLVKRRQWLLSLVCMSMLLFVASFASAQEAGDAEEPAAPDAAKVEKASPVEKPTESVKGSESADDGVSYEMRVKELEEKVNDLKEKIFRSKSRLVLLKETVLRGKIAGSKSVIVHQNEMGSALKLEQAIYSLDGNQIYNKLDRDGDLADKDSIELFNGAIVPGKHNVSVMLVYRGNGYGVFSYLQGYKFTIRSSYTFTAEEGKTTEVKVVAFEKGNFTTALQDRPDVRYEIEFFEEDRSSVTEDKGR